MTDNCPQSSRITKHSPNPSSVIRHPSPRGRLAAEGTVDGLILFSHGSVLCGAGNALEAHVARLREGREWAAVEIGYLNYSRPTFQEAVQRLAAAGIRRISIVPYFLVPGYFVTTSL